MNSTRTLRLSAAGLLLAALTVSALAPAAEANHGWRKYKYGNGDGCGYGYGRPRYVRVVRQDCAPRRYVEFHSSSSSAGPAIAGFIGGVALATILNHHSSHDCDNGYAQAPPPEPAYYYYDPYGQDRYASLDAYYQENRHCGHPQIVQMIDARSGECERTYCRERGRWVEWDGDYSDDDDDDDYGGGGCNR